MRPVEGQDCVCCANRENCYRSHKQEHVALNLIVCRIKRRIDFERSCRLFLIVINPQIRILARDAVRGSNLRWIDAWRDLQTKAIVAIISHYVLGELATVLTFLVGPRGHLTWEARHYRDWYGTERGRAISIDELTVEPDWHEGQETSRTYLARRVISDGSTLTELERYVLSYCLTYARDDSRPISGLHARLSIELGMPRQRVSDLYRDAIAKVARKLSKALD